MVLRTEGSEPGADVSVYSFSPGLNTLASPLQIDLTGVAASVLVDARGATVNYTGTGAALQVVGASNIPLAYRVSVIGGRWQLNGEDWLHVTDAPRTLVGDVDVLEAARAVVLRNDSYWAENTTVRDAAFTYCGMIADFEPASVTGGSGTESFARTRFYNIFGVGGTSYWFRCRGGVYDSRFDMVSGNVGNDLSAVFYCSGAMGGTHIEDVLVEHGDAGSALFAAGSFTGSKPTVGRWKHRGAGGFGDVAAVSNPPA